MAVDLRLRWHGIATAVAGVVLWELVGDLKLVAGGALPSPSQILIRFWADKTDYPPHVLATLQAAILGFVIGNAIAIAAGIAFAWSNTVLRLFRGLNVALFALPPIAIAPVLALTLSGTTPRVVLAALGCYFTTMTATAVGLTQADPRALDVVRAYGGAAWPRLRFVQLRSALPVILSGFRVAAPAAVLGAILAEFGSGGRFGLGTYLLGSLGRADPARLWGIGLTATLIAGLAYALFAIAGHRMLGGSRAITMAAAPPRPPPARSWAGKLLLPIASVVLPLIIWWGLLKVLGAPEMIAKTPAALFDYLVFADTAGTSWGRLLMALSQTLPITAVGLLAGLAFAFALAIFSDVYPQITRSLMPVAMVTQTMPLVALTPLLVLLLGRGTALTIWITISVTFFPAFVTIAQGILMVPRAALEVPRAYGATKFQELRLVAVPAALPYLFAAMRLAVPRALLGVMIAEWLATGRGLGNLLNQSRGYLDYGMIWTVAVVSVLLSIAFYQVVVLAERWTLSRMGMDTTE